MPNDGCRSAALIGRMDVAFRAGDLDALQAAMSGEWSIPNGPIPVAIGTCLEYAIYHSPLGHGSDLDHRGPVSTAS